MLLHPLISQNAKSRRFKPGLGQCVFENFCCMLMYVPFFKENYDDVLSQHIMTYNALRIVSTGIIYRLSNGREWVELAKNARFFSMKDQEEF